MKRKESSQYYIEERYPLAAASELTEKEMRESLAVTERVIVKIRDFLRE